VSTHLQPLRLTVLHFHRPAHSCGDEGLSFQLFQQIMSFDEGPAVKDSMPWKKD
jgi:hypothetical protein